MKRILDPSFKYRPSYATDIRKTFARLRQQRASGADKPKSEREIKVVALEKVKRAGS
jgi:hypothetical protein